MDKILLLVNSDCFTAISFISLTGSSQILRKVVYKSDSENRSKGFYILFVSIITCQMMEILTKLHFNSFISDLLFNVQV